MGHHKKNKKSKHRTPKNVIFEPDVIIGNPIEENSISIMHEIPHQPISNRRHQETLSSNNIYPVAEEIPYPSECNPYQVEEVLVYQEEVPTEREYLSFHRSKQLLFNDNSTISIKVMTENNPVYYIAGVSQGLVQIGNQSLGNNSTTLMMWLAAMVNNSVDEPECLWLRSVGNFNGTLEPNVNIALATNSIGDIYMLFGSYGFYQAPGRDIISNSSVTNILTHWNSQGFIISSRNFTGYERSPVTLAIASDDAAIVGLNKLVLSTGTTVSSGTTASSCLPTDCLIPVPILSTLMSISINGEVNWTVDLNDTITSIAAFNGTQVATSNNECSPDITRLSPLGDITRLSLQGDITRLSPLGDIYVTGTILRKHCSCYTDRCCNRICTTIVTSVQAYLSIFSLSGAFICRHIIHRARRNVFPNSVTATNNTVCWIVQLNDREVEPSVMMGHDGEVNQGAASIMMNEEEITSSASDGTNILLVLSRNGLLLDRVFFSSGQPSTHEKKLYAITDPTGLIYISGYYEGEVRVDNDLRLYSTDIKLFIALYRESCIQQPICNDSLPSLNCPIGWRDIINLESSGSAVDSVIALILNVDRLPLSRRLVTISRVDCRISILVSKVQ